MDDTEKLGYNHYVWALEMQKTDDVRRFPALFRLIYFSIGIFRAISKCIMIMIITMVMIPLIYSPNRPLINPNSWQGCHKG